MLSVVQSHDFVQLPGEGKKVLKDKEPFTLTTRISCFPLVVLAGRAKGCRAIQRYSLDDRGVR